MSSRPDPLAGAKAAVGNADKLITKVEGKPPAKPAAPKSAPPKVSSVPPAKSSPATWGAATRAIIDNGGKLPEMHKGGVVSGKPGEEKVVKLEAGEKVIPAKKEKKVAENKTKKASGPETKTLSVKDVLSNKSDKAPAKKEKKSRVKHTHIEHHSDGSHTIRHTPAEGGEETSYSRPDLDTMLQGVKENVGGGGEEPQEQEQEEPEQAPPSGNAQPSY